MSCETAGAFAPDTDTLPSIVTEGLPSFPPLVTTCSEPTNKHQLSQQDLSDLLFDSELEDLFPHQGLDEYSSSPIIGQDVDLEELFRAVLDDEEPTLPFAAGQPAEAAETAAVSHFNAPKPGAEVKAQGGALGIVTESSAESNSASSTHLTASPADSTAQNQTTAAESSKPSGSGSGSKRARQPLPDQSCMTKEEIHEMRQQRRLAKNRRTAAESRERKKAAAAELNTQMEDLKKENAELKYKLACQEMHSKLLRDELASLTRGARPGTTAATPGPAASVTTNYTLPLVNTNTRQAVVPPSSQMMAACSFLACLYMASQAAGASFEVLSTIGNALAKNIPSTGPEDVAALLSSAPPEALALIQTNLQNRLQQQCSSKLRPTSALAYSDGAQLLAAV